LRTKILILLAVCILLCGFVWTWTVEFAMSVLFPIEEAVDFEMVQEFPSLVNLDDLTIYLTDPILAEQITQDIRSNLSTDAYSSIELPDMTQESPGKRIIRIIIDRIFT